MKKTVSKKDEKEVENSFLMEDFFKREKKVIQDFLKITRKNKKKREKFLEN